MISGFVQVASHFGEIRLVPCQASVFILGVLADGVSTAKRSFYVGVDAAASVFKPHCAAAFGLSESIRSSTYLMIRSRRLSRRGSWMNFKASVYQGKLAACYRSFAYVGFWPKPAIHQISRNARLRCKAVVHRPNWSRCSRIASFNAFTVCRNTSQCPLVQALRATAALPSGLFGRLDCCHGFHRLIASLCFLHGNAASSLMLPFLGSIKWQRWIQIKSACCWPLGGLGGEGVATS